ncbi:MAG: hypothetical protein MJD61_14855 [Proteobacteria bacterium]|nr:hypothetical protein [Pseudomonadota bacterium]
MLDSDYPSPELYDPGDYFADPEFVVLRDSISANLAAMKRGLSIYRMYRSSHWDEQLFWDRLTAAVRAGEFDAYLRRAKPGQLPDVYALWLPHFESGRFDHLIREWAKV